AYGRPTGPLRVTADRASHPAVLAQTRRGWVGLYAPAAGELGFDPGPAPALTADQAEGVEVLSGGSGAHGYDPILRAVYERDRARHPLRGGLGIEPAAELAALGLLRWHYRPEWRVLVETADFAPPHAGRERMHVAWLSGAPAAYAL